MKVSTDNMIAAWDLAADLCEALTADRMTGTPEEKAQILKHLRHVIVPHCRKMADRIFDNRLVRQKRKGLTTSPK